MFKNYFKQFIISHHLTTGFSFPPFSMCVLFKLNWLTRRESELKDSIGIRGRVPRKVCGNPSYFILSCENNSG